MIVRNLNEFRLEGEPNDLPAALTPEKLVQVISEEKPNFFRMFTHFNYCKFLQSNHQPKPIAFEDDILETCVKVFDG